ncbi:MAG: GxxExxY protein [Oceanipulchritudo sp.]
MVLEAVYQESLEHELSLRGIPYLTQHPIKLTYKGHALRQSYIPDFICYEKLILEIKAHKHLLDEHRAQLINYLKATSYTLGILINFGSPERLKFERLANSPEYSCYSRYS